MSEDHKPKKPNQPPDPDDVLRRMLSTPPPKPALKQKKAKKPAK